MAHYAARIAPHGKFSRWLRSPTQLRAAGTPGTGALVLQLCRLPPAGKPPAGSRTTSGWKCSSTVSTARAFHASAQRTANCSHWSRVMVMSNLYLEHEPPTTVPLLTPSPPAARNPRCAGEHGFGGDTRDRLRAREWGHRGLEQVQARRRPSVPSASPRAVRAVTSRCASAAEVWRRLKDAAGSPPVAGVTP
jgi:hypothetical protein